MIKDQYTRELSKLCIWDPREEGLDPNVDINQTKIKHLVKRWLIENGHEAWCTSIGKTPYDVAKMHIPSNSMLLICGYITMDTYKEVSVMPELAGGLQPPVIDDPEEFFQQIREMCTELTDMLNTVDEVELTGLGKLKLPEPAPLTAIDALLTDAKLPQLEALFAAITAVNEAMAEKDGAIRETKKELKERGKDIDRLRAEVTKLASVASVGNIEYTNERGEIPDGKVVMKKVKDLFTQVTLPSALADLEVPSWEWDGEHPDVPAIDDTYIFRPKHLQRALYAILTNQREYIQGHTGTGKTTLIEQVAAHLSWPFIRINFDSEITRMDLIGRDTLVADSDGKVTSVFEDGMLPTAMAGPYICCFDELDFVRPDVAYVMQAALEGGGLRITEDGDRVVRPHPMFRMFGTGNTVGQGDEHGMYQGARPQSMAFLDRFTIWDKVDYLSGKEREELVKRKHPALGDEERKQILQYTTEHLEAFTQGKIIQPISPRGMLAICQATMMLGSVKDALEMSVLDRANNEDRATLKGLVDRCAR